MKKRGLQRGEWNDRDLWRETAVTVNILTHGYGWSLQETVSKNERGLLANSRYTCIGATDNGRECMDHEGRVA